MLGKPSLREHLMRNVSFDTCVYHQPGVDLLMQVVDVDNILFGSEMLGAVRGIDPTTGQYFDAAAITEEQRRRVFAGNALRVYPRLGSRLEALAC